MSVVINRVQILYVEDDQEIGQWVKDELIERNYDVTWLKTGEEIEDHLDEVDIIILDIMLPGLDGFSVGKRIKSTHSNIPILMLSARTAVEDKIEGLSFADDYVTKPFHPDELIARIEVLLRRYGYTDQKVSLQHLQIHTTDFTVTNTATNEEIPLTGKQYALLQYFFRHANQILTKEQIFESVWNEEYIENDKTLMVHIRYLREKIEKYPSNPTIIKTIRGIGYRLNE